MLSLLRNGVSFCSAFVAEKICASSVVKILRFAETLFQFCAFCASSRLKDPFPPRVISG
jgi:hypothetical protein